MKFKPSVVTVALTSLAIASMSIAVRAQAEEPIRGGTAIVHLPTEQKVFNPALRASIAVYAISGKIVEPLVDRTYDGYVGVLATDWSSSADGLNITFNLREGVRWHDGMPFTCEDVSFTAMKFWKELLNYSTVLQSRLEAVDCPDPHTAVFRYSRPMPLNLLIAAMPDLGHPVPKHLYEGKDLMRNELNAVPVGTGPFKAVEYRRGQYFMAERNDDYWRGKQYPYLDRIVWRFIPDASAAAAALEAGEVHMTTFNGIPMADIERFKSNPQYSVGNKGYEASVLHSSIEFNHRNKALADVRVRRAILHGLDINRAIATIMHGYAKPGTGPIPSTGGINYTDDVPVYNYDPIKAKALLDEAGYQPDASGVRLRLRHRSLPAGEYTKLWSEFFAQSMREIGIKITLVPNDTPAFLKGVYRDHDFDTADGWPNFRSDPAVSTMVWLRSGAPAGAPWTNQYGYVNPVLDKLIDDAATELDVGKRAKMYHEIQRIVMEDLPMIFAIEHSPIAVTNNKLRNNHNTPRWISSSWYDLWLDE